MAIVFVDKQIKSDFHFFRTTKSGHYILNNEWRDWIRSSLEMEEDKLKLFKTAQKHNFDPSSIILELGGFNTLDLNESEILEYKKNIWEVWAKCPVIDPDNNPRAWKLDTHYAQLYEIPKFLDLEICNTIIDAINCDLTPSTVTTGKSEYFRTSRTCSLTKVDPYLSRELDRKISNLMGAHTSLADKIEGLRYDPGEYFKPHYDWFNEGESYYEYQTKTGGQRTWTVMIYLNTVEEGGETNFTRIGRTFSAVAGTALCWNNLYHDGRPNPYTMHEALPVIKGPKYVITKWFRESPGLNEY